MKNIAKYHSEEQCQSLSGFYFDRELFAGNCCQDKTRNYSEYYLYSLDQFDKTLVEGIKLKENERIFISNTDMMKSFGRYIFVKVNIEKMLIYYNVADQDTEDVIFETRGIKLRYLNLRYN